MRQSVLEAGGQEKGGKSSILSRGSHLIKKRESGSKASWINPGEGRIRRGERDRGGKREEVQTQDSREQSGLGGTCLFYNFGGLRI